MSDETTLLQIYRLHAGGGPSRTVDDVLHRAANIVARRRRIVRRLAIPAAMVAAMALILGKPIIQDAILSNASPPSAATSGCEEARPNIYPAMPAPTNFEVQENSAAFMPIGAEAGRVSASLRCNQQPENP